MKNKMIWAVVGLALSSAWAESPSACEMAMLHTNTTDDHSTHRVVWRQNYQVGVEQFVVDSMVYDSQGRPKVAYWIVEGVLDSMRFTGTDSSYRWSYPAIGTSYTYYGECVKKVSTDTILEICTLIQDTHLVSRQARQWTPNCLTEWDEPVDSFSNPENVVTATNCKIAGTWYFDQRSVDGKNSWRCVDEQDTCNCTDLLSTKKLVLKQRGDTLEMDMLGLGNLALVRWLPVAKAGVTSLRNWSRPVGTEWISLHGAMNPLVPNTELPQKYGYIRVPAVLPSK